MFVCDIRLFFLFVSICVWSFSVGFAVVFFFFKQKTAYEMRISDWSSDVCSSDLRWFRWLGYLALAGLLGIALIWAIFARDLPSVDQLRDYEPPLPTMVRDGQGKPVHAYARERRVQLEIGRAHV